MEKDEKDRMTAIRQGGCLALAVALSAVIISCLSALLEKLNEIL
jgi:hypothetical protein